LQFSVRITLLSVKNSFLTFYLDKFKKNRKKILIIQLENLFFFFYFAKKIAQKHRFIVIRIYGEILNNFHAYNQRQKTNYISFYNYIFRKKI
jgi:hypothetical protein